MAAKNNKDQIDKTNRKLYRDTLAEKINKDSEYEKRMFTDFSFAKQELTKTGIELTPETHEQLAKGYEMLKSAALEALPDPDPLGGGIGIKVGVNY
jgi:hypothetical protein